MEYYGAFGSQFLSLTYSSCIIHAILHLLPFLSVHTAFHLDLQRLVEGKMDSRHFAVQGKLMIQTE